MADIDAASPALGGRPGSLAEVAERAREGFDARLREFLDCFYTAESTARGRMIAGEPAQIAPVHDAYLAAVAEHLARRFGLGIPQWTDNPGRFLARPFFAGGLDSLKAILIAESPAAFRRRLIFVSADALSRPRDPSVTSPWPSPGA